MLRALVTALASVGLALLLLIPLGIGSSSLAGARSASGGTGITSRANGTNPAGFPISHVIIVMMENHAYDSLFGAYCNANNVSQIANNSCPNLANGTPPQAWSVGILRNLSHPLRGYVHAFFWKGNQLANLQNCKHDWNASQKSLDNGRMDGFSMSCLGSATPMGEYNGTTIPTYWDLAQEFGLGDSMFSSVLTSSLGNHWYLLAGNAPPVGFSKGLSTLSTSAHHDYLNQANATNTVEQLIGANNSSLSWKYYDWALVPYQFAIRIGLSSSLTPGSAYNAWNPLAAKNQSYAGTTPRHFGPRNSFYTDLKAGNLPNVSWVIPSSNQSDHPPANITQGERLVQQVVDAVEGSSFWNSTAIFVTWDDFGGFYDSVAPPLIMNGTQIVPAPRPVGLSFRTPVIVISPYTPAGLVLHTSLDFESLLAFIEWRFGLGCLTTRDCGELQSLHAGFGALGFFPLAGNGTRPSVYIAPPSNATYPVPPVAPPAAPFVTAATPADATEED